MSLDPERNKNQLSKIYVLLNLGLLSAFIFISNLSSFDNSQQVHRFPSSKLSNKEKILRPGKSRPLLDKHTEKLKSPFNVEIERASSSKNIGDNDVQTFIGYVHTSQKYESADILWSLPKDLQLVSGDLRQTIHQINPGQPFRTEITVRGDMTKNHRIHLKAGVTVGQARFSANAQYQTLHQKDLDSGKKQLSEKATDYLLNKKGKKIIR